MALKPEPHSPDAKKGVEEHCLRYGLYTYVSINFLFNRGGHVYRFTDMISCFQDLQCLLYSVRQESSWMRLGRQTRGRPCLPEDLGRLGVMVSGVMVWAIQDLGYLIRRFVVRYDARTVCSYVQDPLRTSMGNSIPTAIAIAIWAVLQVPLPSWTHCQAFRRGYCIILLILNVGYKLPLSARHLITTLSCCLQVCRRHA